MFWLDVLKAGFRKTHVCSQILQTKKPERIKPRTAPAPQLRGVIVFLFLTQNNTPIILHVTTEINTKLHPSTDNRIQRRYKE